MWKFADIDTQKKYRIALCQSPNGLRHFSLVDIDETNLPSDTVFLTEIAPIEFLQKRNVMAIAKNLKLTSGEGFHVDAHGVWLTRQEWEAMQGSDWSNVPWLNGIPPLFAPK